MNNKAASRWIISAALVVVAVTVVWGFSLAGSPAFNRKVSSDSNRVQDLSRLRDEIDEYYRLFRKLPDKLPELEKVSSRGAEQRRFDDPTSNKPYEYMITGPYGYQLCSEFEVTSDDAALEQNYFVRDSTWKHGIGHHCFSLEIPEGRRSTN